MCQKHPDSCLFIEILVYRLDKIQKNTNLDLRNFEDAIAFKIALMVVKYMKHMDTMD